MMNDSVIITAVINNGDNNAFIAIIKMTTDGRCIRRRLTVADGRNIRHARPGFYRLGDYSLSSLATAQLPPTNFRPRTPRMYTGARKLAESDGCDISPTPP